MEKISIYALALSVCLFSSHSWGWNDQNISKLNNAPYSCDQIVKKSTFKVCYNYKLKAPLWTKHTVSKADLNKEAYSRDNIRFYSERAIPKKYRSKYSDLTHSGYDRGHMVNNRDMAFNRKFQKETFSMANIAPQTKELNRGIFRYAENLTRKLSKRHKKSLIFTGNIFERINPKRIGAGQIAVPSHSWKVIYFPEINESLAFLFPNVKKDLGKKPSKYRVSVSEIEKRIGFKFKF